MSRWWQLYTVSTNGPQVSHSHQCKSILVSVELSIKLSLTARVMFMAVIILIYHVRYAIPIIIPKAIWFLLRTHAH